MNPLLVDHILLDTFKLGNILQGYIKYNYIYNTITLLIQNYN